MLRLLLFKMYGALRRDLDLLTRRRAGLRLPHASHTRLVHHARLRYASLGRQVRWGRYALRRHQLWRHQLWRHQRRWLRWRWLCVDRARGLLR